MKIQGEIRYIILVFAFIAGRTPPEYPPIAAHYGVEEQRACEIIGWALMCDGSDRSLAQTNGQMYSEPSGVRVSRWQESAARNAG